MAEVDEVFLEDSVEKNTHNDSRVELVELGSSSDEDEKNGIQGTRLSNGGPPPAPVRIIRPIVPLWCVRQNNILQQRLHEIRNTRKRRNSNDYEITEVSSEGRLLVNVRKPASDPEVYVADHLTDVLQPHQLQGVKFMYDNVIESIESHSKSNGSGCILAHSMGLGKTLQVITFVEIFFRCTTFKRVIIVCPVNTIQNWANEFDKWLPEKDSSGNIIRKFRVFLLNDTVKGLKGRADFVAEWFSTGGALLISYEMFKLLTISGDKKSKKHGSKNFDAVLDAMVASNSSDVSEENNQTIIDSQLRKSLKDSLVCPGADMIVCDEGHQIKNMKTDKSASLNAVYTKRRIVLTGYPLQNNLWEYYCMVSFVRPGHLGTKKNFREMFEKPINAALCNDASPTAIRLCKMRTHVLQTKLAEFVQRRTQHLLKKILPDSKEYVILVRKSPIQQILYRAFVSETNTDITDQNSSFNPLKAHTICVKILNHPDLLYNAREERKKRELSRLLRQDSLARKDTQDSNLSRPSVSTEDGTNSRSATDISNGFSSTSFQGNAIQNFVDGVINSESSVGEFQQQNNLQKQQAQNFSSLNDSLYSSNLISTSLSNSCLIQAQQQFLVCNNFLQASQISSNNCWNNANGGANFSQFNTSFNSNYASGDGNFSYQNNQINASLIQSSIQQGQGFGYPSSIPYSQVSAPNFYENKMFGGANYSQMAPSNPFGLQQTNFQQQNYSSMPLYSDQSEFKPASELMLQQQSTENIVQKNTAQNIKLGQRSLSSFAANQNEQFLNFSEAFLHSENATLTNPPISAINNDCGISSKSSTTVESPTMADALRKTATKPAEAISFRRGDCVTILSKCSKSGNENGINVCADGQRPSTSASVESTSHNSVPDLMALAPPQRSKGRLSKAGKLTLGDALLEDDEKIDSSVKLEWTDLPLRNYKTGVLEHGAKMALAFSIIDETTKRGEKILFFSSSVNTLNIFETFLNARNLCTADGAETKWQRNTNFCRFDGRTSGMERERLINRFNSEPELFLFLISTKAGSLGINLVSASRVIIFDASWNPCDDAQAICRIYRYGQRKRTFIYRLIMNNSMEKAIFHRQIAKSTLQQKVVDQQNIDANVSTKELETLFLYDNDADTKPLATVIEKWELQDDLLLKVAKNKLNLFADSPFLHESLMLESEDKLSEEEKCEAELLYEREINGSYLGGYEGDYGGGNNFYRGSNFGRPGANPWSAMSGDRIPSHISLPPNGGIGNVGESMVDLASPPRLFPPDFAFSHPGAAAFNRAYRRAEFGDGVSHSAMMNPPPPPGGSFSSPNLSDEEAMALHQRLTNPTPFPKTLRLLNSGQIGSSDEHADFFANLGRESEEDLDIPCLLPTGTLPKTLAEALGSPQLSSFGREKAGHSEPHSSDGDLSQPLSLAADAERGSETIASSSGECLLSDSPEKPMKTEEISRNSPSASYGRPYSVAADGRVIVVKDIKLPSIRPGGGIIELKAGEKTVLCRTSNGTYLKTADGNLLDATDTIYSVSNSQAKERNIRHGFIPQQIFNPFQNGARIGTSFGGNCLRSQKRKRFDPSEEVIELE